MEIKTIKAREILDSKSEPTVEVVLETGQGKFFASCPSGISKGKYEALELRDGGKRLRGRGVKKACQNIERIIASALKGEDPGEQDEIDSILIELDGTKNKSRLGANAILAVSMAVCRAGAKARKVSLWQHIADLAGNEKPKLPIPCFLLFEGGLHGQEKSTRPGLVATQEFMLVMEKGSLAERIANVKQLYETTRTVLGALTTGKEGGLASLAGNTGTVLEATNMVLRKAKLRAKLILDFAASHFFRQRKYYFEGKRFSREELVKFYKKLVVKYPILGIEDPFSQEDCQGFKKITKQLGKKTLIIGDDLLVTNLELTEKAVKEKACNAMVIKPNQIGTITETIGVANFAKSRGLKIFAKHRGGETNDSFLADLAVGIGADYICAGGLLQKERLAKYRRLLEIEKELKK